MNRSYFEAHHCGISSSLHLLLGITSLAHCPQIPSICVLTTRHLLRPSITGPRFTLSPRLQITAGKAQESSRIDQCVF